MKTKNTLIATVLLSSLLVNTAFGIEQSRASQGCGTVVAKSEYFDKDPYKKDTSWGGGGGLEFLGMLGGLGALVSTVGANLISAGRDAVNSSESPADGAPKTNATMLTVKADMESDGQWGKWMKRYGGWSAPEPELANARDTATKFAVGQRVKIISFDEKRDGTTLYLFEEAKSTLPEDIKSPDVEYLNECYSKTPEGYTTLASRADSNGYLKIIPAPEVAIQKLSERDELLANTPVLQPLTKTKK